MTMVRVCKKGSLYETTKSLRSYTVESWLGEFNTYKKTDDKAKQQKITCNLDDESLNNWITERKEEL